MMEWTEDYTTPPPSLLDQIKAAQAADRREQRRRQIAANIQNGIDMFVAGRMVPQAQVTPFDENMKAFLLSRKVGQEDQAMDIARAKLERETRGNLSDQPAPPEWGAIAGMTRKEALAAGYGRAPNAADAARRAEREDERRWREEQAAAERKWREGENAKDRAVRQETAKLANENRDAVNEGRRSDQERKNREDDSKAAMGPDFDPLDTSSPLYSDDTSKRAFMTSATAARQLSASVGTAREIVKQYGTNPVNYPPDAMTQLQSAIADIRTQIKTIDALGVIAGPDMPAFISPQIDNPATFGNWARAAFWKYDPLAQLDQLERNMKGGIAERAKGLGVKIRRDGAFGRYADTPPSVSSAPASMKIDPQDAAAKAWADANPNDPRAAKIREALKAKGIR